MISEVFFSRPEASCSYVTSSERVRPHERTNSALNSLAIILVALGILGQAWVGYQGRTTGSPSAIEYYITLCLIFLPPTLVIVSRRSTTRSKIGFALYMAVALLGTRFMLYPNLFVYHDEIIHEGNALAIDRTAHLFTVNTLLPVTPYYPGLEISTSAIQQLTGLPLHAAGTAVLLLVRIVMTLSLIRIVEKITGSVLAGSLATAIYATNPQYIFFNSQFSYQSVALPLCFFCIFVFSIRRKSQGFRAVIPSASVAMAVAVTHHLTSLALVMLIWTWFTLAKMKKQPVSQLFALAVVSLLAVGAWTWVARSVVVPYIDGILQNDLAGIINLFGGTLGHTFFADSAGDKTPAWEALLSVASVLFVSVMLIPALWHMFKKRRLLSAAALVLVISAALYPIVPAGHLAAATGETADRSCGFLFVGLGYLFAIWWFPKVSSRRHAKTSRLVFPRPTWLLVLILIICFAGGTVGGSGPDWAYGPGKYLVSADNRSVDQLALQAGYWEGQNLPPNGRVFTDRVNGLIAETFGSQHVLTSLEDGIKVGSVSVLLLAKPAPSDARVACENHVQFVIADQRLSTSLPHVDAYIDNGEYLFGTRRTPPSLSALTKFDKVAGAERIFDNGAIRIYDLRGLACT